MKRSSTSSNVHESCEKQPAAKRSWGIGSLLHGLAGYVRPKHGSAKEKSSCNAVNSETETISRDTRVSRDGESETYSRSTISERVPVINQFVDAGLNVGASSRNEMPSHVRNYESNVSRSSTFNYTQSNADCTDQQQRTPLLPRFRRNTRNR